MAFIPKLLMTSSMQSSWAPCHIQVLSGFDQLYDSFSLWSKNFTARVRLSILLLQNQLVDKDFILLEPGANVKDNQQYDLWQVGTWKHTSRCAEDLLHAGLMFLQWLHLKKRLFDQGRCCWFFWGIRCQVLTSLQEWHGAPDNNVVVYLWSM